MIKLYIDTNVIIDAVEGRKNKLGKNIGNSASDLFLQAVSCKYYCIISSWTLYELSKKCESDTTMFFQMIKKKCIRVDCDESDEDNARIRSPTNFDDALHIVIAEREKTDYIVTRNIEDFRRIRMVVPIRRPEDLI